MQPVLPLEAMHAALQSLIYFITLIGSVASMFLAARS